MYPHPGSWQPLAMLASLVAVSVLATTTLTVESGDTLGAIADRHDVTVAQLIDWNGIDDPDRIFVGDTLIVAAPEDGTGGSPAQSVDSYRIATGDTLSAIARRFGVSVAHLVSSNAIDDPDRIIAGRPLIVGTAGPATIISDAATTSYTVRTGDSLSAIAAAYDMTMTRLAGINGISDPHRIYIDQILKLDDGSTGASSPATTTTTVAPPATTTPTTTTIAPPATNTPTTTTIAPPATTVARSRDAAPLAALFVRWSDAYDVPQDLLEALTWKESDWRPDAVGPGGHLGIGQLSPETVSFIESRLLGREMDPLDPSDGLRMSARFLRYLLDRTSSDREALAAWTQGLASVQTGGISAAGGVYADAVLEIRHQRA